MKQTINSIQVAIATVIITLIVTFAVVKPMSRSEAHSILSQTGTVIIDSGWMTYHTDGSDLLEIELEALYTLSKNYEGVNLVYIYK